MITRYISPISTGLCCMFIAGGLAASAITFSEALDNSLAWTTGGSANWFTTNAAATPTFDGVDAAASGTIGNNEISWLETIVNGPGEIRFWWSCSTEPEPYDPYIFSVDGEEVAQIYGEENWQYISYAITNTGSVTLRWEYSRDFAFGGGFNRAYLDRVQFLTNQPIALNEALNTSSSLVEWTTGGNPNPTYWEAQTNSSHSDGISVESGAITTSQTSWMETTVYGVTNLSFWWKVSSVTNQGYLRFYTNNVQVFQISGEVGWQQELNIPLSSGTNTLRWSFETTPSAIGKLNRGWVDEVSLSPFFGPATPITLSTPVLTNGQVEFDVNFESGWPCRVQYTDDLVAGVWTDLLSTNTTSAVTSVVDSSATNSPSSRFYRAVAP